MQDLGIYPLPNGSPFEGNLCLICPILIFFFIRFFLFHSEWKGKPLAPVREDTRRAFYISSKCGNYGQIRGSHEMCRFW